ncbi:hypothetical protein ACJROX_07695 [Pseudalkalibacillus sp. A8]|uniref:hypothetical protein n=1 Tax=Pseudalkalibacillus sp. A8 TaxID=3382641 RepID=UPI0038B49F59
MVKLTILKKYQVKDIKGYEVRDKNIINKQKNELFVDLLSLSTSLCIPYRQLLDYINFNAITRTGVACKR